MRVSGGGGDEMENSGIRILRIKFYLSLMVE